MFRNCFTLCQGVRDLYAAPGSSRDKLDKVTETGLHRLLLKVILMDLPSSKGIEGLKSASKLLNKKGRKKKRRADIDDDDSDSVV